VRKLVYYVGTSIDGYISGPNGEIDFYPLADDVYSWIKREFPETLPTHIRNQIGLVEENQRFDAVIMGRGTYEPALDINITSPYRHLRQYVVSTRLGEIADQEVELIEDDVIKFVHNLKAESGMDIWLAGGGVLAASLLSEIDELIVKCYPLVAGAGRPMVDGVLHPTMFDLIDTCRFDSGALVLSYQRAEHKI